MAFKQNPDKKPRWEELSKAALIKTVKTLSARQTKLLNQIAKLERDYDAMVKLAASLPASVPSPEVAALYRMAPLPALDPAIAVRSRNGIAPPRPKFPWEQSRDDVGSGNNQTECTDKRDT